MGVVWGIFRVGFQEEVACQRSIKCHLRRDGERK